MTRPLALTATLLTAWLAGASPASAVEDQVEMFASAKQVDSCLLQVGTKSCTMDFVIDTVPHALVIITSPSKTLTVSLTDPNSVVTPIGSTGPGITGSDTYPEDADTNPRVTGKDYIFRLTNAQSGTWTVNISEGTVIADTPVVMNAWLQSDIAGFMVGGGESYPLGAEVRLGMVLVDGTAPLSGYAVDASVFRLGDNTFTPTAVSFADDGVAPDDTAADGMFTGSIVLSEAGEYQCRTTVTGNAGPTPYRRDLFALFTVNAQDATLVTGTLSDTGVDTNANGLFDNITVSIDVNATIAADYLVLMNLRASGGAEVSASTTLPLPVGLSTVDVVFDHQLIRELGEDGPYDVDFIRLDKVLPDSPAIQDMIYVQGQTTAYLLSQLERDAILFTGLTDSGLDCDTDGDFDRLDLELTVDVLTAGTYQYSMALLDSQGEEIEFLAGSAVLAVGPNMLTLEVSGAAIGVHGVDGPYTLGSVLFFGAGESVVSGTVGTTAAYTVDQFETPVITEPFQTGFESFSPGQIWGQQGWALSAGPAPAAVVISTTSPRTGTQSIEMRRDPALADDTQWGVFSPIMTPNRDLKQEISLWLQIEAAAGPDYEVLIQSPTDGFVSAWMRFAGDGDVEVLATTGVFLSTGFNWLDEIGAEVYFQVVLTVDTQAPTTTQISIEINGITVFNGGHVGSDFFEQLALVTNNTGPNDVALFADDIRLEHQFLLSDCDSNGVPDACQALPPECPECGDGSLDPQEECDDGNTVAGDGCNADCEIEVSDGCGAPQTLLGGLTPFSTVSATTDGPDYFGVADCGAFGDDQIYNDIWYDYTAPCSGTLLVTTCEELGGGANYDTRLAIHDGCGVAPACPADPVIECNDDDPVNPCGGLFHSTLSVPVAQGNCYKVRVGGFGPADAGTGSLLVQCTGTICGDGLIEGAEQCDDSNLSIGDGCDQNCIIETCGNGVAQIGEQCDDGDGIDNNDCTNACGNATCGDGITWNQGTGTEQCDDADANDNNDCTTACQNATCGDGITWDQGTGTEQCDDSDGIDNNDCTNACGNATCGDGITWNQGTGTEQCDDADANDNNDCTTACQNATCGDGITWDQGAGTEQCDDSDGVDNNDCTNACLNATCGDGSIWNQGTGTEQCDDGDGVDNNDCTNACGNATCGDGITWNQGTGTEQCDDADANDNNDCTTACLDATCGDGVTWDQGTGTELCDDGDGVDNNDCTNACMNAICGDGITWDQGSGTEECDDGNMMPGDGCDENCAQECLVGCSGDEECDNNDVCTFDVCNQTEQCCENTSRLFGDADNDSVVDLLDISCVLECYNGDFNESCTLMNTDFAPCPGGDGQCDLDDILHIIDASGGADYCSCGTP